MKIRTRVACSVNCWPGILVLLGIICVLVKPVTGGTTWDSGGADDLWGTGANWDDNVAPTPGSGVDLTFGSGARTTPNNNYNAYDDWRSILFSSGSSSFTISGNAIDLFWKVENNSANLQTWNCDIGAAGTGLELNPLSGDLTVGSANIYNNAKDVIAYGGEQGVGLGKTLTISGNLQNGGKLIVRKDAKVKVTGSSAYSGNTEIDRGDFILGTGGSVASTTRIYVGNGSAQSDTARLFIEPTSVTLARPITVYSGADSTKRVIGGLNTSGAATYSGGILLDDDVTFDTASGGSVALITSALTDGAGSGRIITKTGAGTLDFTATGNLASTLDSPKWQLNQGTIQLAAVDRLGANPGAVQADYLTLNGGTIKPTSTSMTLGKRGLTVGASGGSVDLNSQNQGLTFDTAETLLGSGRLILRNGGRVGINAPQTGWSGTLQTGNGSGTGNAYSMIVFGSSTAFTLGGTIEINDPSSGAPTIMGNYGSGTVTIGGNLKFTGQVWNAPCLALYSRYSSDIMNLGAAAVVSAESLGNAGWLGIRAGGDPNVNNQMFIQGILQDGVGKLNVAYQDGAGNWMSYKVSGNNTYTGGGTLAGGSPGSANMLGTHIMQGTVYFGHANALGANNANNPISIFRQTGNQSSSYAGMLSDTATDVTLGNQQTMTLKPNKRVVNVFTIGGNGAVNTIYNNPIVVADSGGVNTGLGLLLSQAASGKTTFAGSMTASSWNTANMQSPVFEKRGAGTVDLQNVNSSLKATPVVRNGTLLLEANAPGTGTTGVLGDPTMTGYGLDTAVHLGGKRSASGLSNVRIATLSNLGGTYTATAGANSIGQLTDISNGSTALDGTTLAVNDRVLVILQGNSDTGSSGNAPANGIYKVSAIPSTVTLDRETDAVVPGSWVTVNTVAGKINSGKTFYLANQNTTFNNGGSSGTAQVWLEDESANTSATLNPSLLANAAVTIARAITVNSSPAIATATLGGSSDHNAIFSGAITLNRNLQLTSATTGANKTTISGLIDDAAGSFGITKIGSGVVELCKETGNTFDGGVTVSAGTLLVNNANASGTGTGAVSVENTATLGGTGVISGTVTVKNGGDLALGASVGTLNVGGLTLEKNSDIICEIAGAASFDTVVANGTLTLPTGTDKTYIVIPSGSTLAPNTSYDVISYSWMSGGGAANIEAINDADSLGVSVTLTGTKVRLTTTPEPGVIGLALLGLLALRKS